MSTGEQRGGGVPGVHPPPFLGSRPWKREGGGREGEGNRMGGGASLEIQASSGCPDLPPSTPAEDLRGHPLPGPT